MRVFTAILLLLGFLTNAQELRHAVYFDTDVYTTSEAENFKFLEFLKTLDTSEVKSIQILGYCDDRGTKAYNLRLSKNRANSIKNTLEQHALSNVKITTISGKGELPLTSNDATKIPLERQSNRRVDIIINPENKIIENPENNSRVIVITGYPNDNTEVLNGELKVGDKIRFKSLYFEIGYSFLVPESKKQLEKIAKIMVKRNTIFFTIEGHVCCTKGNNDAIDRSTKKRNLSLARAKYIYDYLASKGVEKYRMKYKGLERKFPLGGDPKYDRRVEFIITYVGE